MQCVGKVEIAEAVLRNLPCQKLYIVFIFFLKQKKMNFVVFTVPNRNVRAYGGCLDSKRR